MQSLYLPYQAEFDRKTRTRCITGEDRRGQPFGVGAGPTIEACEGALRDYVLEVLEDHAVRGEDRFDDLGTEVPAGPHVVFSALDLLPIRLKLARSRAKLRQSDMAARLGITQQAYAKLERPGGNLTLRTILQLEQALGEHLLDLAWSPLGRAASR